MYSLEEINVAELNRAFGDRLRRARRAAGLTQEGLAERAGVSSRLISDLERGVIRAPRRDTLEMLADALDATSDERATLEELRRRGSRRSTSDQRRETPATGSLARRSNLPSPLDPLIGREREVDTIRRRLANARLVTLTGPGGIGKTRLGIAAGHAVIDDYADGVYFVDLAPVRDPNQVAAAVLRSIGAQELPGYTAADSLATLLSQSNILLVIDNFEHVLDAAAGVATLLEQAPGLHALVTSRARLGLQGEYEYLVPPMDVPESSRQLSLGQLLATPSVTLFVERVRQIRPEFDLNDDNGRIVAEICRRLDGWPLALELAAARMKVMSPQELLSRLNDPLTVLVSGSRNMPERQQTVARTLAWSYDLLDTTEQQFFRQLSVFVGGWTLSAAEAVGCEGEILDRLASLVDHSLVTQASQPDGQTRFRMLEIVREFAAQRLQVNGEADPAQSRHADHFMSRAQEIAPNLRGEHGVERFAELSQDHGNLQAALTYALSTDPDRALHVIAILEKYWFTRGSFDEWELWIDEALLRSSGTSDSDRASALAQSAFVLVHSNELERARSAAEEALAIASDLGVTEIMGRAVADLGLVARARGDLAGAMDLSRQALDLYTESGDEITYAAQLGNVAILEMDLGEYERAISTFEVSFDVLLAHGETFFATTSLLNLGEVCRILGRLDQADETLIEAINLSRTLGAPQLAGEALVVRANVMIDRGDDDSAVRLLVEAFAADINRLSREGILLSIASVAMIAVRRDDASLAARLFGAAGALRATMSITLTQPDQQRLSRYLTDCRSGLGEAEWQRAWNAGQLLSLTQATTLAHDALARWYSGGPG